MSYLQRLGTAGVTTEGQPEATSPAVRDGLLLAVVVPEQSNPQGLFANKFTGGQV